MITIGYEPGAALSSIDNSFTDLVRNEPILTENSMLL